MVSVSFSSSGQGARDVRNQIGISKTKKKTLIRSNPKIMLSTNPSPPIQELPDPPDSPSSNSQLSGVEEFYDALDSQPELASTIPLNSSLLPGIFIPLPNKLTRF
jgi:hypothetical protein